MGVDADGLGCPSDIYMSNSVGSINRIIRSAFDSGGTIKVKPADRFRDGLITGQAYQTLLNFDGDIRNACLVITY